MSVTEYAERFTLYFEALGSQVFATTMAKQPFFDEAAGQRCVMEELSKEEVIAAASFHGDIGQRKVTLDAHAAKEQGAAFAGSTEEEAEALRQTLLKEGEEYKAKHGIKFLVFATGKSGNEMLNILRGRVNNANEEEWKAARTAIWSIALNRLKQSELYKVTSNIFDGIQNKPKACAVAICTNTGISTQTYGECDASSFLEMASLSKMVAAAFCMEYFFKLGIALETPVNKVLEDMGDDYRLPVADGLPKEYAMKATLEHCMSHMGLNMHYVKGIPLGSQKMASMREYLNGFQYNPDPVAVISEPGEKFKYSGAGFILLQYIVEQREKKPIAELTRKFLDDCGAHEFTMEVENLPGVNYVTGYNDAGEAVEGTRKMFPAFAAGGMGTTAGMLKFLQALQHAYKDLEGYNGVISHATARRMLFPRDKDMSFMGCKMGIGIFVLEGGTNKYMLHQGANDGFRVLNLLCYEGPDTGKGFVVVTTGDVSGVFVNAEVSQKVLRVLNVSQCDYSQFHAEFSKDGLKQEDVVNKGYRQLVFQAFKNLRAEYIVDKGPKDPLADFNLLRKGTGVKFVSNDRFARCENVFSDYLPAWDPELFGCMGKVMDSWESERHNFKGVDEAILNVPSGSTCRYLFLSTMFHNGNQAPVVAVQVLDTKSQQWTEILPKVDMGAHSYRYIDLGDQTVAFDEVKIQIFPDGGFSRLGVYTDVPEEFKSKFVPLKDSVSTRHEEDIPLTKKPLSIEYESTPKRVAENLSKLTKGQLYDCANEAFGCTFVSASNEHYGKASNTINPFPALSMFDGLESARSRRPNSQENMTVKLRKPHGIKRIVLDLTYFVNNAPVDAEVEGQLEGDGDKWIKLLPRQAVKHYAAGTGVFDLPEEISAQPVQLIRAKAYPCGGFNRLHCFAVYDGEQ